MDFTPSASPTGLPSAMPTQLPSAFPTLLPTIFDQSSDSENTSIASAYLITGCVLGSAGLVGLVWTFMKPKVNFHVSADDLSFEANDLGQGDLSLEEAVL